MKTSQKINKNKFGAVIMALLIVAYIPPLCLASGETGLGAASGESSDIGKYPDVPGAPDSAVQYNKTDVTPVAEMEQVKAGEPALFQYKNMTMLMDCTQNCALVVTTDPAVTPKVLGLSVETNESMLLTMNTYASPLQGEAVMERTLNFYWGLEPNAELQLKAQLRLLISQTELNQELNRIVNASRLTWMYWNRTQAQWIPVESYMDQNGYLVCNTNHLSTWTVAEHYNATATGSPPDVPGGVPENAIQYNKTDVTPVTEMQQVKAGEPALFIYRNMTLLMNCTQNCSIVFTADPDVTPKILGLSVDSAQNMTLTMNMYRSPLQGEQVTERTLNFYLGIEPNAEVELKAQIRLHIDEAELNQELNRVVNASRLTWMYWNRTQAQWMPVESFMDENGYLVCNTDHFSTWTVAELADTTETPSDTNQGGIPAEYLYIVAVAIVIIVVVAGVFAYKKRK